MMERFIKNFTIEGYYAKNFTYSMLGKIVSAIALVMFDVVVARQLGIEEYGEWVFYYAILTMLFYVGWLGINTSAKVFVSKCEDVHEQNRMIFASLCLRFVASVFFAILMVILITLCLKYTAINGRYQYINGLMYIAVPVVYVNAFTEFFKEVLIGLKKYKQLLELSICEYTGYLLFSAILLAIYKNVYAVAVGYLVGGLVTLLFGFFLIQYLTGFVSFINRDKICGLVYEVFKYAIPLAIMGVGSVVLLEMDTLLLGLLSTNEQTATYSIGKNLCSKLAHINYAMATAIIPSMSLRIKKGKLKKYDFKKYEKYNFIVSVFVTTILFVFANIYVYMLYGNQYKDAVINLKMLSPYYLMTGFSVFYAQFLDFSGKAKERAIAYMFMIGLNFILDIALIPHTGAVGASLATDISLIPYAITVYFLTKLRVKEINNSSEEIQV